MTFDQLEMLEAIIKYGSFQSASKKIRKSQPSLSIGIKKLEEEFNITIFSRESYRPQLTKAGKAFFEKAKQTLRAFRNLDNLGKELGLGIESEIIFSVDALLPLSKFKNLLQNFIDQEINTILKFESDILSDISTKLLEKKVTFGIGGKFIESSHIKYKSFDHIEMIPVIHKDKLESNPKYILEKLPQIIVTSNQKNNHQMGVFDLSKKWYVSDHHQKENLILNKLGWGYLPKYKYLEKNNKDKLVPIKHDLLQPSKFEIFIMRNTEIPLGPIGKKIWNYF